MNKMIVWFSVVFCALYLHWTFGGPLPDERGFNLNDQDVEQEAKNLARFQEVIRKALSLPDEVQQPYDAQSEMVKKDSLSNDVTAANDLDGNDKSGVDKPKKHGKCWFCWCKYC